jgi:hypothetical protein
MQMLRRLFSAFFCFLTTEFVEGLFTHGEGCDEHSEMILH